MFDRSTVWSWYELVQQVPTSEYCGSFVRVELRDGSYDVAIDDVLLYSRDEITSLISLFFWADVNWWCFACFLHFSSAKLW